MMRAISCPRSLIAERDIGEEGVVRIVILRALKFDPLECIKQMLNLRNTRAQIFFKCMP